MRSRREPRKIAALFYDGFFATATCIEMTSPSISLVYMASALSEEAPRDFLKDFEDAGIDADTVKQDGVRVLMGIDWLMPTAVILYLGKSYFDGFLGEMGKDHYSLLKRTVRSLHSRINHSDFKSLKRQAGEWVELPEGPYSSVFSVMAEGSDGLRFKLLVDRPVSPERLEVAVEAFITFLDSYHQRVTSNTDDENSEGRQLGSQTVLFAYDHELGRLQVMDPMREAREQKSRRSAKRSD